MEFKFNLPRYCNNDDRLCVQLLLDELCRWGRVISVHDGEEWMLKKCSDPDLVLDTLSHTGEDTIDVFDRLGHHLGQFWLIYNNGSEGDPMICITDYTANKFCETVVNHIQLRLDGDDNGITND
tara:strand:- start:12894 stop:13265 length:372 start_codon:yes stop_codon:yes gene_type:complete